MSKKTSSEAGTRSIANLQKHQTGTMLLSVLFLLLLVFLIVFFTRRTVSGLQDDYKNNLLMSIAASEALPADEAVESGEITDEVPESPDEYEASDAPASGTLGETTKNDLEQVLADTYEIQKGDTLSGISLTSGYSVDALASYNGIRNVNLIYAGSALRIPTADNPAGVPEE